MDKRTDRLDKTAQQKKQNTINENVDSETYGSPDEIRARIENTRQQMGETIEEIQERLSVANITEQVKDEVSDQLSSAWQSTKESVYDATVKKTGDVMGYINEGIHELSETKVGRAARNNPFAVTLIGAGVGMLLYNLYQNRSSAVNGTRGKKAASAGQSALEEAKDKAENAYSSVSSTAANAYESVADTAGRAFTATGNAVSSAYDTVGNAGTQIKNTAEDLAHQAHDQYDHYMEENPLAVGAVALAVGAAVGLSLPSTDFESGLVGDARDELLDQAGEKVGNLLDSAEDTVKDKLERAAAAADEKADEAIDRAKTFADKTVEKAVKESKKKV